MLSAGLMLIDVIWPSEMMLLIQNDFDLFDMFVQNKKSQVSDFLNTRRVFVSLVSKSTS